MNQPIDKVVNQTDKKPEQKPASAPPSLLDGTDSVINQVFKYLSNPFILLVGVVTTLFLMTRDRQQINNNLIKENAELKERIKTVESELKKVKKKFKKFKTIQIESPSNNQEDYSFECKPPVKLPETTQKRRMLFLD